MITYEIVSVGPHWTVIQYKDGVCRGGDLHWLSKGMAEAAHLVYRRWPALHGATESTVMDAMNRLSLTPNQPRYIDI